MLKALAAACLCIVAAAAAPGVTHVRVEERVPTGHWQGLPVYKLSWAQDDGTNGTVHRQDEELWQLNALMKKVDKHAPTLKSTSTDNVDNYLAQVLGQDSLVASKEFHSFLSLNTTGAEISNICWQYKYMVGGMIDFIETLASKTLPAFAPEFQPITEGTMFTQEETPLECWVYTKSIQMGLKDIMVVYGLNLNYSNAMVTNQATFMRPNDDDVIMPGASAVTTYPTDFQAYPVHNQAGNPGDLNGYLNGGNLRLEHTSQGKFYFLIEDNIRSWVIKTHLGGSDDNPKRFDKLKILDVGSGCALSTMVYGDLFPNSEVTGIDISAPYVRYGRARAQFRDSRNTKFYLLNAQNMSAIPAATYDIISFTYVLHEMRTENGLAVLKEMQRVLKPGGTITGFEVSYISNFVERKALEHFTTFGALGDKDYLLTGLHGPEPFMVEFQNLKLPEKFQQLFPVGAKSTMLSQFDTVYFGGKAK